MIKRGKNLTLLFTLLILIVFSFSVLAGDLLPLQGNVDLSGTPLSSGALVVEIWDGPDVAGSNLIYNSTENFTGSGNISSGKFDIVLGDALDKDQLNLEYGKAYYMDLYIAGNDMNFSGKERQVFMSSVGTINSSFLNTSNDYELNSLLIENKTIAVDDPYLNISDGTMPKFIVQPDGKVGIGTTSPSVTLDVQGVGGTTIGIQTSGRFNSDSSSGGYWANNNAFFGVHSGNLMLYLNGASRLYILDSGNVGIGTTAPTGLLTIENASTAVSNAYLNISDGVNAKLIVYPDGNVVIGGGEQPANDTMFLTIAGGGDLNVSGSIYYGGSQLTGSPFVVESVDGEPIPVCMKNSMGKWVGCMPDANNNWQCAPNRECDKKVLRIKTTKKLRDEGADDVEIGKKIEALKQKFKQGKSLQAIKDEVRAEVGEMKVLDELDDEQPNGEPFSITQSVSTDFSEDINALKSENDALRNEINGLKDELAELKVLLNSQTSTPSEQQPVEETSPTEEQQPAEEPAEDQPSEEQGFSITGASIWSFFSKLF